MPTRSYIQLRDQNGARWRHGEQSTDAARDAAKYILESGVQEGVAIALVHVDPAEGEKKIEPLQVPPWLEVDLTDDAAGVSFFIKGTL